MTSRLGESSLRPFDHEPRRFFCLESNGGVGHGWFKHLKLAVVFIQVDYQSCTL